MFCCCLCLISANELLNIFFEFKFFNLRSNLSFLVFKIFIFIIFLDFGSTGGLMCIILVWFIDFLNDDLSEFCLSFLFDDYYLIFSLSNSIFISLSLILFILFNLNLSLDCFILFNKVYSLTSNFLSFNYLIF